MKSLKILISVVVCFFCFQQNYAQTLNFNSLENARHIINVGVGWDYSLSYSAGYTHKINYKLPLFLNANFSIPSGEKILDDFKIKMGGQVVVLNKDHLKGSVTLNVIFRKYENPLVRLLNFGSEVKGTFGYYKSKWFVAGEIGFDKAIVTHFKHSKIFEDNIYPDGVEGWYEPATGGNIFFGMQTGYSFKKYDFTLNIGKVISQDFKSTPMIPYYIMLGFNYRFP